MRDDATAIDDHDPIGERVGFFEVVRRQQHRFAVLDECANLRPKSAARFDVESDRRLVEDQQIGIAADGERKQHALFLSAGQLAEFLRLDAAESRRGDDLRERHRIGVVSGEERDVFAYAQRLRHARDLQHRSGAGAIGGVARIGVEDTSDARRRRGEAEE